MHNRRIRSLLIIAVPLALIIISSLLFLLRVTRDTMRHLPEIIKSIADERINGTVDIGSIDVFLTKGIVIRNVTITGARKDGPVIRIPRATMKANLIDLALKRKDIQSAIELIDIENPTVSIGRRKDGHWNIYDLLKPSVGKKAVQIKGPIQVRSAKVAVLDYAYAHSPTPEINRFHNVDAVVTFPDVESIEVHAAGMGDPIRVSRFAGSCKYNLDKKTYTIHVNLVDAAAKYWSRYPHNTKLGILEGVANGSVNLNKYDVGRPLDYSISATVAKTAFIFGGIRRPINGINGSLEINRDIVGLKLNAMFGASPFSISGYVVDFAKPQLALDVASDRVNFREVIRDTDYSRSFGGAELPVGGRVEARVIGAPSSPGVQFRASTLAFTFQNLKVDSMSADGIYARKRFVINKASAIGYGGGADFGGTIDLKGTTRVDLAGKVNSIRLHDLPYLKGLDFTGLGSGPVNLSWQPGNLKAEYDITVKSPRYRKLAFHDGVVAGSYDNGTFLVDNLTTGLYGGILNAAGSIGKGNVLDLRVSGTNINLAATGRQTGKSRIVGHAQFAGRLTGSLVFPAFNGLVEAYKVSASGVQIERISGNIAADRNKVIVDKLTVFDYPGTLTLSGGISNPLSKQPTLDLAVAADSLDIDRLSQFAKITGLSGGILSADVKVAGRLRKPNAQGSVKITDILYRNIPIDAANAQMVYRNGALDISALDLSSGAAHLAAKGAISQDGSINVAINGDHIALERVSEYLKPYASVSGNLSIDGSVTGTLSSPIAALTMTGTDPIVNGRKFSSISGSVSVNRSSASIKDFDLAEPGSIYGISSASYDFHEKNLVVDAKVHDGQGSTLISLLDLSPYVLAPANGNARLGDLLRAIPRPFGAKVNASIAGNVRFLPEGIAPNLSLDSAVTDLSYGASTIKDIAMKGSWRDGIVSLDQFDAVDGDTNISADASLGPKDALSLRADVHNLSVAALRQLTKLPDNFSGKADVTIVASGSRYKPSAQMSLEIVDPVIAGSKFDRLRSRFSSQGVDAGRPNPEKTDSVGLIDVDEITLVLNDHNFRTSGYIPVDWRSLTLKRDSPILLESTLDADVLSFISAFGGLGIGTRQGGRFEGTARMAGTLMEPLFSGVLAWRNGYLNIPRINQPFEIDQADISLASNKITIDTMKGHSARGGNFSIDGNVTMAGFNPVLDLSVNADALKISAKNLSNTYGENVDAQITGNVKMSGPFHSPAIKGIASVLNGQVSMSGKPVPETPPTILVFDPTFDMKVSLGPNLNFRAAILRLPLRGNIDINGQLSKLSVDGKIDISDGLISFPMRPMKLMNGSVAVVHVRPNQSSGVTLDIQGQTKLTAMSSLRQQKRYTVTMNARGSLDSLNTHFYSSPPGLSEDAILGLLTGQRQLEQILGSGKSGAIGEGLSGLFTSAVLPGVFDPISQAFEKALGLEEFTIEMGYNEPLQLTLGRTLWDGVILSYSAFLGSRPDYADSQYELKLTKRLKGNLEIGVSTNQNKDVKALIEGRFNF